MKGVAFVVLLALAGCKQSTVMQQRSAAPPADAGALHFGNLHEGNDPVELPGAWAKAIAITAPAAQQRYGDDLDAAKVRVSADDKSIRVTWTRAVPDPNERDGEVDLDVSSAGVARHLRPIPPGMLRAMSIDDALRALTDSGASR